MRVLIEYGAKVNLLNGINSVSSLLIASQNGRAETVKLLLQKGADASYKDKHDGSPLLAAAHFGHTETCKVLLEHGVNIDTKGLGSGCTALHLATREGKYNHSLLLTHYLLAN